MLSQKQNRSKRLRSECLRQEAPDWVIDVNAPDALTKRLQRDEAKFGQKLDVIDASCNPRRESQVQGCQLDKSVSNKTFSSAISYLF